MANLPKYERVIRVETKTITEERVVTSKALSEKHGTTQTRETIERTTVTGPAAVLECGHWLMYGAWARPHNTERDPRSLKRALCYACWLEKEKLEQHNVEAKGLAPERNSR